MNNFDFSNDSVPERIMRQFSTPQVMTSTDLMEAIVSSGCNGDGKCKMDNLRAGRMPYSIEFLADVLPAVQYVGQFYLELIIHGGLEAKDTFNQGKLDEWLSRKNILGQTNGNVIRQALFDSIVYGYSGLRRVANDLIYVSPTKFRILKLPAYIGSRPVPGVATPTFYEVYTRDKKVPVEKADGEAPNQKLQELIKNLGLNRGVDGSFYLGEDPTVVDRVFLLPEYFCHLRHSDEGDYGISPLSKDRLRITAIVDYIANMIDEIDNDGTDYNVYTQMRSQVGGSLANMISQQSADGIVSASIDSKEAKNASDANMEAAKRLARKMKRSSKTRINVINQNSIDKIEKQPGTVDLYRYNTIWDDAKGVVADIYGIPAMLAGSSGGGWSTGMSALIPFTLERTIKPFQQRYAEQLSSMIISCAGLKGNIKFKEIDWTDAQNALELDKIRSEAERNHAQAVKYLAEAGAAESSTATENANE